jgi:3-hydroxyanthranilate 3,4-dioxygenase
MLVAGPNARKDYHYNETELFYQLEGSIKLLFKRGCPQGNGTPCGRHVFAPANVPHSPVRSAGSIGLVIERKRVGKRIYGRTFMALRQLQPQTVRSKI